MQPSLGWEWSSWSGCDPFRVGAVLLEWVQTSLGWVWYFRVSAVGADLGVGADLIRVGAVLLECDLIRVGAVLLEWV